MEVRAVVFGLLIAIVPEGRAAAEEAAPSSTAAFPDSAPPESAAPNAPSRAGFPVPERPRPAASTPNATQYPGSRAPSGSSPPGTYQYGGAYPGSSRGVGPSLPYDAGAYGRNPYGSSAEGPTSYGARYTGPYGSNPYGGNAYGGLPGADRAAASGAESSEPESVRYASLTLSAIRLVLPVFEATLEARPTEHIGVAVFGGLGKAPPKIIGQTLFQGSDSVSVHEVGGQFLIYPFQAFDGFVVGAEVSYTKGSGTVSAEGTASDASASATAFGPLIGGKWIHESGFTLLAHAGVERVWLGAESTVAGQSYRYSDSIWFPLLDLNVGWSF